MERTGAAAVIIGSEVLTAKVQDVNGPRLIRRLRERGVPLHSFEVVHDDVDAIVEAVTRAHRKAAAVITSGGIGPTHDDVTVRAVALALGRTVVRMPEMVALIESHYPDTLSPEALRLADVPQGTRLLAQEGTWFPVLACEGVYLLPGVPQLFTVQLETVLRRLPGIPLFERALYLSAGEAAIAGVLERVALGMPDVAIGSYPQLGPEAGYRVKLTLEGPDAARVELAFEQLSRGLPVGSVLRAEP